MGLNQLSMFVEVAVTRLKTTTRCQWCPCSHCLEQAAADEHFGQMLGDAELRRPHRIGCPVSLSSGFGWMENKDEQGDGGKEGEVAAALARVLRTLDGFVS